MPLNYQLVNVPFTQGLDTKSDPLQVPLGKLTEAINARVLKTGQITKRPGCSELGMTTSTGGTLTGVVGVSTYQDQLLAFNGSNAYTWSPLQWRWEGAQRFISADVISRDIASPPSNNYLNPDVLYALGREVYVYQYGASICALALDWNTRSQILSATVGTGTEAKIVFAGSSAVITYVKADHKIYYRIYDLIGGTLGTETLLVNQALVTTNHSYDVVVVGTSVYVAYCYTNTNTWINVIQFTTALAQVTNYAFDTGLGGGALGNLALYDDTARTSRVVLGYTIKTTTYALNTRSFTAGFGSIVTCTPLSVGYSYDTSVHMCIGISPLSNSIYTYLELNDTTVPRVVTCTSHLTLGTQSVNSNQYGVCLSGKPVYDSGNCYLPITAPYDRFHNLPGIQGFSGLTINQEPSGASGHRLVAKAGMGLTTSPRTSKNVAETPMVSTSVYLMPVAQMCGLNGTSAHQGVSSHEINLSSRAAYRSVEINSELFVGGGVPHTYDGTQMVDAGFLQTPESIFYASNSGAIPAGTYMYCFTYQWTDSHGVIHESAPSVPYKASIAVPFQISFSVSTQTLTEKNNIRIVGWRTQNLDASTGGAPNYTYYRFTSATSPSLNDRTINFVTITDNNADWLDTNESLYTDGGRLENSVVPALKNPTVWKNRVWAIGPDNMTLWYSKLSEAGYPIEWNDTQQYRVDDRYGSLTALFPMDAALIIFTESTIYMLSGNGPDNMGQNSDYGFPDLVTTDCGCSNADSLVMTPNGIMFQSKKGIYLLNRSFQASYVGAPIETYNALTISDAVLMPTCNEVRFTCSDGHALVYNYLYDLWSTWTLSNRYGSGIWKGTYFHWNATKIYTENDVSDGIGYADQGIDSAPLTITTGWIAMGNLVPYQKIRKFILTAGANLYESAIPTHTISVYLAYNYNDTWSTPVVFNSSDLANTLPEQIQVFLAHPTCEALKIKIVVTPTGDFSSFNPCNLSGLTFQIGVRPGAFPVPANRRVSV